MDLEEQLASLSSHSYLQMVHKWSPCECETPDPAFWSNQTFIVIMDNMTIV